MNKKKYTYEIVITAIGTFFVLGFSFMFVYLNTQTILKLWQDDSVGEMTENMVFVLIALLLIYGAFIYLINRLGNLLRFRAHTNIDFRELMKWVYEAEAAPALTILIPSYKEEYNTNLMTLYSAALLEYPNKHVVLLIDDPTNPGLKEDKEALTETRALPGHIQGILDEQKTRAQELYDSFVIRVSEGDISIEHEFSKVADLYQETAEWFEEMIRNFIVTNHVEHFFANRIYREGYDRFSQTAKELRSKDVQVDPEDVIKRIERHYKRVIGHFTATVTSFERKQYINLSHEPNKAMNLNSYIGLIGGSYSFEDENGALKIVTHESENASLQIPSADYVITLDADSIFSSDYAVRLVYLMEQEAHEKTAVIQTPYNTYPCPFNTLEYVAGATTDIQYLIHQGFVSFNAGFWVGANALLRYRALKDIEESDTERGYEIKRYVQDRTVIEDTESSIDLVYKGWEIFNYPDKLAHSATPPDFGSLLIQRRRWANGGVIIFPKLVLYLLFGKNAWSRKIVEFFVRSHYLLSIAFVNIGLLIMFLYPFDGNVHVGYLMLASVPYFVFYSRDLIRLGYRFTDLFKVYALNLLLLPVNLGGVLKSFQQGLLKNKIAFGRTPKVRGRTLAPKIYLLAEIALFSYLSASFFVDVYFERYAHGIFALVNALFIGYAIVRYIGVRNILHDIFLQR